MRITFTLFDLDGTGELSLDKMTRYLFSIFRMIYKLHPHLERETGRDAHDLAEETTQQAFDLYDLNEDKVLSRVATLVLPRRDIWRW